jgi:hypothetical protein
MAWLGLQKLLKLKAKTLTEKGEVMDIRCLLLTFALSLGSAVQKSTPQVSDAISNVPEKVSSDPEVVEGKKNTPNLSDISQIGDKKPAVQTDDFDVLAKRFAALKKR